MGWPKEEINLHTLKVNNVTDDAHIQLLSSAEKVTFTVNDDNTLTLQPPQSGTDQLISKYAVVFKLSGFDLDIQS